MGWKNRISRFNGKMTKEKWLLLLLIGVLLMILSFPLPGGSKKDKNAGGQIAGAGTEGAGAVLSRDAYPSAEDFSRAVSRRFCAAVWMRPSASLQKAGLISIPM